jgi:type IV pilus assembly protein PilM
MMGLRTAQSLYFDVSMAFFQKPAIGLDISDHSIEAVFIVKKGNRLELASYGRTTLPPGLVVDGYVERRDELSVILRKLLADQMQPPLPRGLNRIVFALSESQIYSHIFEVPRIADDAELARSLAFEADGYFPYNHLELTSGMTTINIRPEKKDIYYAAVHGETLKSFLSLFQVSGLEPLAIEGESTSIARATLQAQEPDPVLLVDIGARVTNLAVFDRNGVQFSEALGTAGESFTSALARALAISPEDAESLKQHQGISGELDLKASKALKAEIDRLIKDVRSAIAWYENHAKRLIKRVIVCGGSIQMPGLLDHLVKNLPTPERNYRVQLAEPWFGLEADPILEKLGVRARGSLITTAIGLGLRGAGIQKFAEINFLANASAPAPSRPTAAYRPPGSAELRPRPSSHLKALPHGLKIGLIVAGVLAVAAGTWALAFKVVPRFRKPSAAPPPATANPTEIAIETPLAIGADFSIEDGKIQATLIDVETTASKLVTHAATAVEGLSVGTVRIVNNSSGGQTLIATTRLLSESGVLFRIKDRVFVPAGGNVAVAVAADKPGAAGDIPPSRFTVPGLPPSQQQLVYGESDAAMTGGATYSGTPLRAEELQAVKDAMAAEVKGELVGKAREEAGDLVALEGLFGLGAVETPEAPEVGKPVGDFTLAGTVHGIQVAFSKDEIRQVLEDRVKRLLPEGETLDGYVIGEAVYEIKSVDLAKGTAELTVRATAKKK